MSIQRRKTSQATGEQGTEQQVCITEANVPLEEIKCSANFHAVLESRSPCKWYAALESRVPYLQVVVGLAAVLGEFLGVSSSFLSLSCLPWVGVLSFGFVSKSCSCPLGWSWSLSRFRAPFSSLLCFLSPRGTPEAIAKFSVHQVVFAPVGLGTSSIVNSTLERL